MRICLIFDMDGTLLRTNELHVKAFVDAFAEMDRRISPRRIRPLIGMGGDKLIEKVSGWRTGGAKNKALGERKGEIFRGRYLKKARAFPKVRELFRELKRRKIGRAIASAAERDELKRMLKIARIDDLVSHVVSSDDVRRPKPAPDVVRSAVRKLRARPPMCALVGDTPYDIRSAHRAKVRCFAVRTGGWSRAKLKSADAIFNDVGDILRRLDEIELFFR